MRTKLFFLTLITLFTSVAFAQDFKVLASKGGNTIQVNGAKDWTPLLVGKQLNKGDKITVPANGYLGLAHKSGKTIELKKAGVYDVNNLTSQVSAQNSGTVNKYADYLAGEISKSGNEDMAKNRYKYMSVTGSVERGTEAIKVLAPDGQTNSIFSNTLVIKWMPEKSVTTYVVKVIDLFGEEVMTTETQGTSVTLTLDAKKASSVTYKVYSKENNSVESKDFFVSFLKENEANAINKELQELQSQLGSDGALTKMVLANFFEEKKLFYDALRNYEAAIKLEPEVDDFIVAEGQFLERAKVAQPAAK